MAEMVKFADNFGNIHYVTWAQIIDVQFFAHTRTATIVTAASGTSHNTTGHAYEIPVSQATAQAPG